MSDVDLWPAPVETADPLTGFIEAEPVPPPPSAPRGQLAAEAVWWDAVAAEAATRSAQVRGTLDQQARAELARDKVAPTWRSADVGTVSLAMSKDRVDVADEAAYLAWVTERFPEQVETIATTRIRPAYDDLVRKSAAKRGAACTDDGQVIPGLKFVPGGEPRGISIRATSDAKASAAALAGAALDGLFEARTLAPQVAPLVLEQLQQEAGA